MTSPRENVPLQLQLRAKAHIWCSREKQQLNVAVNNATKKQQLNVAVNNAVRTIFGFAFRRREFSKFESIEGMFEKAK